MTDEHQPSPARQTPPTQDIKRLLALADEEVSRRHWRWDKGIGWTPENGHTSPMKDCVHTDCTFTRNVHSALIKDVRHGQKEEAEGRDVRAEADVRPVVNEALRSFAQLCVAMCGAFGETAAWPKEVREAAEVVGHELAAPSSAGVTPPQDNIDVYGEQGGPGWGR